MYEPTVLMQMVELWHLGSPELHSSTSGDTEMRVRTPFPSVLCPLFPVLLSPLGWRR